MYEYKATIDRVIDGDTMDFILDLGFHIEKKVRIRIRDYDAPEVRGVERPEGLKVKLRATDILSKAQDLIVVTSKDRSFDRWVGDVYVDGYDFKELIRDEQ